MIKNIYIDDNLIDGSYPETNGKMQHLEDLIENILANMNQETHNPKELIKALRIVNELLKINNLPQIEVEKFNLTSNEYEFKQKLNPILEYILHKDDTDYSVLFKKQKLISQEEFEHIQKLLNELKIKIHSLDIEQEWKVRIQEALNELINQLDRNISKYKENMGKAVEIIDLIGYANEKALKPIQETVTKLFTEIRKVIGKENGIEIKSNLLEYKEDIENVEVTETNQLDS